MLYRVEIEDAISYNGSYLDTFDLLEALSYFSMNSQGCNACTLSRLIPSQVLRGAFVAEVFASNQN